MTKTELIYKVEHEPLSLPLGIKVNEFQTIPDEGRYGILIKDAGGNYFFLSDNPRFAGNKSTYTDHHPSKYGYKYSYRNFGNVEIAIPSSGFKISGHFEQSTISKTKTIIIEFDTFVSVNQNF